MKNTINSSNRFEVFIPRSEAINYVLARKSENSETKE